MEILSIFIATICFLIGCYIIHKFVIPINENPIHFANWYYFLEFGLMTFLAIFFLGDDPNKYWGLKSIPQDEFSSIKIQVNYIIAWCAIGFPLGMVLTDKFFKKFNLKTDILDYYRLPLQEAKKSDLILLLLTLLYTFYIIYKIGFIPQHKMLSLSSFEIARLRYNLTFNFPANVHLKELIGMHLILVFNFSSFLKLINSKNKFYIIEFILYFLMSLFFVTLNLNKSGITSLIIGYFFCYCLSYKINLRKFLLSIFILGITLLSSYFITNKSISINLLSGIKNRVLYSQTYGNYLSLYYFPKEIDHIGFNSISRLISKLGIDYKKPAPIKIMKAIKNEKVGKETGGYMASHYLAESWANFSYLGVILSPLFVGFLIKFFINIIINNPKNSLLGGLLIFLSFRLATTSDFNHLLFPRYLLIVFILFLILSKLQTYKSNDE